MKKPKISEPVPAATLILARPHESGFQVYLLKRSPKSRFLPDAYVFPGGTLELEDYGLARWKDHLDMDPESLEAQLGGTGFSAEEALPYALAAVRETFEEAGIWMAHKSGSKNGDLEGLLKLRNREDLSTDWFLSAVKGEGWRIQLRVLKRWSHWITPTAMPMRFDTRFYLTQMPEDQVCRPDMKETVAGVWVTPLEALKGNFTGKIPLSPPILVTLHELLACDSIEKLSHAADDRLWGEALQPRFIPLTRGGVIVEPWDPMYHEDSIPIKNSPGDADVLPPEAPFSRIWYDGSRWRPVGIS